MKIISMLETNIKLIVDQINSKCRELGRDPSEITLVGVSKKKPIEIIQDAIKYGIKDLGENKAQELKYKAEIGLTNINWHFVGHLQSNKAKDVVKYAKLIHSVDSLKLAREIDKRAKNINKVQNILLEVKTSGEESKYGLQSDKDLNELAEYCKFAGNLNLLGLMTMAPYTNDMELIRSSFKSLRNIFSKLNDKGFSLKELSMGMTNDYNIALEEGATILRIGTAIFGKR